MSNVEQSEIDDTVRQLKDAASSNSLNEESFKSDSNDFDDEHFGESEELNPLERQFRFLFYKLTFLIVFLFSAFIFGFAFFSEFNKADPVFVNNEAIESVHSYFVKSKPVLLDTVALIGSTSEQVSSLAMMVEKLSSQKASSDPGLVDIGLKIDELSKQLAQNTVNWQDEISKIQNELELTSAEVSLLSEPPKISANVEPIQESVGYRYKFKNVKD